MKRRLFPLDKHADGVNYPCPNIYTRYSKAPIMTASKDYEINIIYVRPRIKILATVLGRGGGDGSVAAHRWGSVGFVYSHLRASRNEGESLPICSRKRYPCVNRRGHPRGLGVATDRGGL